MSNDGLKIILIAIISLIVILILVLVAIYYKDKLAKKREEEEQAPKNDEEIKQDKKSVFRFMEFDEVEDNMIVQDNGARYLMVVECKGINYDLLSGVEKASVEEGFIQFLNTLKHEIQLYIQTRKVNLSQSTIRYNERLERIRLDLQREEEKYRDMQRLPNVTKDELLKEIKEVTKKRNLYEYGKDIIENTEQMAENRDITTKQYYIIIPYYTEEITSAGDFDKREISSMAFSELYTRSQTIVSGLTSCDVRGKILNSQELVELLYVAYNREQYDIYDFETYMSQSGYQSLYSVSEDVLDKKMKALDDEIVKKANQKAIDAFEYTSNEVRMRKKMIDEKQENMQQYVDNLAEQIVDSESEVIGKAMAERTKFNIRKMSEKKEKEKNEKEKKANKVDENSDEASYTDDSTNIATSNVDTTPKKQLTEEERRKKLLARKRKLKKLKEMKEREKNEEEQNG